MAVKDQGLRLIDLYQKLMLNIWTLNHFSTFQETNLVELLIGLLQSIIIT